MRCPCDRQDHLDKPVRPLSKGEEVRPGYQLLSYENYKRVIIVKIVLIAS